MKTAFVLFILMFCMACVEDTDELTLNHNGVLVTVNCSPEPVATINMVNLLGPYSQTGRNLNVKIKRTEDSHNLYNTVATTRWDSDIYMLSTNDRLQVEMFLRSMNQQPRVMVVHTDRFGQDDIVVKDFPTFTNMQIETCINQMEL